MENIFVEFLPPWVETGIQPAFYDKESGTVLQQTARMYARVNMLIRMFNKLSKQTKDEVERFEDEVNDTVEEYINKFNELHDYVHDYFDNLDVQQEINNKLDDMVEAGTLQEIIADYLNSKAVFGYDNVSSMKSSTNLIDGSYAETLGYYSVNDGGSALYKIREIDNDDVVDEKFIIAIGSDNLVAELITGNTVNVCQIGGQQNFASVCNYILSKGKNVYVPKGSFNAEETIAFTSPSLSFISDGDITFTDESSVLFSIRASYTKLRSNGILYVGNTNDAIHVCDGNHNSYTDDVYIHRISGCYNGIVFNPDTTVGCQVSRFEFDRISCSNIGIYFNAGNNGKPWVSTCNFIGGEISAPYGIVARKGTNQTDQYSDCSFYRITFSGSIECGLDLQFAGRNYFNQIRLAEGLVGTYLIKLDNCGNNIIENEFEIPLEKVQIVSPANQYDRDVLVGKCITSGGSYIGYRANVFLSNFIIPTDDLLQPERSWLTGTSGTAVWDNTAPYYYDGMTVIVGSYENEAQTLNYTLPDAISKKGVKHFFLKVARQKADSTITLTTRDGDTISVPSGYLNNATYRVDFIMTGPAVTSYRWTLTQI